ncbi:hypothetical protein GCM10028807_17630 [Spirosoma daeguense]
MKFEVIGNRKPLILTIFKYAKITETERKVALFIRQNIARFTTLAELEKAVFAELELMRRNDKRVAKITTHTWIYCHSKDGKFKALSFNSNTRKGFLFAKENWRKTSLATPGQA